MLTYNNTKIETLKFGNTDIETGIFNGVMVFEKRQENTVILRTTKPTVLLTVATKEGLDVDVWNAGEKVAVLKHGIRTEVLLKDTGQDIIIKGHDIIKLYCTESQLTSLNVQELTALQWLDCNNNQLTSLNMQGLTALQGLDCNNNQLTSLNVQGCTALHRLDCSSNQLTSLNVQGCTALQWLGCSINQLTSLNMQGLAALQGLDCNFNQLMSLNVQGCTALHRLYCNYNQLTSLNVQGRTALHRLYCNNNQLTSLNMQGLTTLQELGCSYNQLTASTFKDIFINLAKTKGGGDACLYYDYDSNYKDFTQPPELARAFNAAKAKGWKFYKNSKKDENLL